MFLNLDLDMQWHNFHPHASHWSFGGQHLDNRSIGPAEAFVVETTAPPVVLPFCDADEGPKRTVRMSANFPIHCHVEPHVMGGMVALMRTTQEVEVTQAQENALGFPLPEEKPFACPIPEADLCIDTVDRGSWQTLQQAPVFAVHGALLKTGKVILWSGHAELGTTYPLESAQYDPATDSYTLLLFRGQRGSLLRRLSLSARWSFGSWRRCQCRSGSFNPYFRPKFRILDPA